LHLRHEILDRRAVGHVEGQCHRDVTDVAAGVLGKGGVEIAYCDPEPLAENGCAVAFPYRAPPVIATTAPLRLIGRVGISPPAR
jgi:hypothetical protein